MSQLSIKAYYDNEEQFINDEAKVLYLIKTEPRINGLILEHYMKKPFSTFSGRLTSLRSKGLIYILEGEGTYSQYVAELDEDRQKELKGIYNRGKDIKRINRFLERFGDRLNTSGKAAINAMLEMIEAELTETEKMDLITQGLID